jgi:hypothetical protein
MAQRPGDLGGERARAVKPGMSDIEAGTLRSLAFDGRPGVTLPPGASTSDPVELEHAVAGNLAITLHFAGAPAGQTAPSGPARRASS